MLLPYHLTNNDDNKFKNKHRLNWLDGFAQVGLVSSFV